jgi:hypothetical protein
MKRRLKGINLSPNTRNNLIVLGILGAVLGLVILIGNLNESSPAPTTNATTATVSPVEEPTTTAQLDPAGVVREYFAALNAQDYNRAWELGGKSIGGTQFSNSFGAFMTRFDDIKHIDAKITGGNGVEIAATVVETHNDGSKITYLATYTVEDGVITNEFRDNVTRVTKPKPKPAPKPKTILDISGSGSHTHATRQFTIPNNWHFEIHWSYRASGLFAGESVNFVLEVRSPDDGGLGETLVNELDTHGAGVEEWGGSGAYWLSVLSESRWTLRVVQVPDGCLTDSPPDCP